MSKDRTNKKQGDIEPPWFGFEGMDAEDGRAMFERMFEFVGASLDAEDGGTLDSDLIPGIEDMFHDMISEFAAVSEELLQAQELVLLARQQDDSAKTIQLAHEALQVCPDCADAWNVLAERADSLEESLELFERAAEAGRRTIGDNFVRFKGHLWDYHPARPYLRALEGTGASYELMRQHDLAIAAYCKLLELSPIDEHNIRWMLLPLLLLVKSHDEARNLIDRYADDLYALWPYSRLLLAFVEGRPEAELSLLLDEARASNRHVIPFLLDDLPVPEEMPEFFRVGDESEAVSILPSLLPVWKTTPGLTAWFRKAVAARGWDIELEREDRSQRTQALLKQAVAVAQASDAVWQVDYCKIAAEGETFWSILAVDPSSQRVRHEELLQSKPQPADVFLFILAAMVDPEESGAPLRPVKVYFAKKTLAKSLTKRLEKLSVECEVGELAELGKLRDFVRHMTQGSATSNADPRDAETVAGMVWLVGAAQMGTPIEEDGVRFRPWALLVIDQATGLVLQVDVTAEIPGPERLCDLVQRSIFSSASGKAIKPEVIYVRTHDERTTLAEPLGEWGIRCEVGEAFQPFDEAIDHLQSQMASGSLPSLSGVAEITPNDLTCFYEAASEFYQAAPWVLTRPDAVFRIKSSDYEFPVYAIVMGQLGAVFGLALFTDLDDVQRKFDDMRASVSQTMASIAGSSWSLLFGEQDGISAEDADAIDVNGWPIAAPEAFPMVVQIIAGELSAPSHRDHVDLMRQSLAALAHAQYPIASLQKMKLPGSTETWDQGQGIDVELEPVAG